MQDFFYEQQGATVTESPIVGLPQQSFFEHADASQPTTNYEFQSSASKIQQDDDFGPAEEDEVTKRIKLEEETLNARLSKKTNEQYEAKLKRKQQGKRALRQFNQAKQKEVLQRKKENLQSEERHLQQYKKLNAEGGWTKVVTNIKTKIGEHQGKKDVSRMREAILHKKEDEKK